MTSAFTIPTTIHRLHRRPPKLLRQTLRHPAFRPNPPSHKRATITSCATDELPNQSPLPKSNESTPQQTDEQIQEEFVRALEAKQLKWADLPFRNVQQELALIDQYEKEEELDQNDPWPKFLRGAAYEHWGQPQLALAQYAKTNNAGGLRRIPELWERRAYNAFKIGNVAAAHSYYEIALGLFYESAGNELHIVHWFYDNFKDHLPKWNGPPAPLQRGICQYCAGQHKEARTSLVPQIEFRQQDMDHSLLWFLASAAKFASDGILTPPDARIVRDALESDYEWNPRLKMFINLFHAAGQGLYGEVSEVEQQLSDAVKKDEKDDVTTHLYMALYHDAFTNDTTERDRALDIVTAIGGTASPRDTENFLFHAAKNRITVPDSGSNPEIPEIVPQ